MGKRLLLEHVNNLLRDPPHHPQYDHLNYIPRFLCSLFSFVYSLQLLLESIQEEILGRSQ
jgi:hypothetical protein